jgi:hydroxymethylbilane synthase
MNILCGARSSLLSRAQVKEVQAALLPFSLSLHMVWVETLGDRDRKTSLRALDKTDFFTRELDQLLLSGAIRMAVHSAKDLPDPIPVGLAVAAVTKGIDPRDSLVFSKCMPSFPRIATSSVRREESVLSLYPHALFIDLRGMIHERLQILVQGGADGVVIAEAALIRLELTHLPRVFLPGSTPAGQGRLAILIREDDEEMRQLMEPFHDPLPWN